MSPKKEERMLRVLEKTADQMDEVAAGMKAADAARTAKPVDYGQLMAQEREASLAARTAAEADTGEDEEEMPVREYDAIPNEGGNPYVASPASLTKYSVICPDCGQLVPSIYDSFISRELADAYARQHCDCHRLDQVNRRTYITNLISAILSLQEPDDRLRVPLPPGPPKSGTCRYCGQSRSVVGCTTESQADEYATRCCKCSGAIAYQDRLIALQRRDDALEKAADNIDDLFGTGAKMREEEYVREDAIEFLKLGAQLVYDQTIVNQSSALTGTIKSKISRNAKGVLSIERKDTTSSKVEV